MSACHGWSAGLRLLCVPHTTYMPREAEDTVCQNEIRACSGEPAPADEGAVDAQRLGKKRGKRVGKGAAAWHKHTHTHRHTHTHTHSLARSRSLNQRGRAAWHLVLAWVLTLWRVLWCGAQVGKGAEVGGKKGCC